MKVVVNIKEKNVDETIEMLKEYFCLTVDRKYVERLVNKYSDLLREVHDGAVTDTYARDLFIDRIAEDLGMSSHWPRYCDGEEYATKWYKKFAKATAAKGLKFEIPNG